MTDRCPCGTYPAWACADRPRCGAARYQASLEKLMREEEEAEIINPDHGRVYEREVLEASCAEIPRLVDMDGVGGLAMSEGHAGDRTMPVNHQQLRDAGFDGMESYRDETALRLLCAFNGVDWKKAPPAWWAHPNAGSREAWKRVADEARRIYLETEPLPRVLHVRRGTEYDIINREAELQTNRELVDGDSMVIYRGNDGRMWVRHVEEFDDGRFVEVADAGPKP